MKEPKRLYTAPDSGKKYPLFEAPYKYDIKCFRVDLRKAQRGSSDKCIIALGGLRDPAVEAIYIGAGKDAYVCFKATKLREAFALHFTINTEAQRVRDYFDTHADMLTKQITLSVPTAGRTLAYRAKLDKRRRAEIKAGAEVKRRERPRQDRLARIGVPYRPRAIIVNNNVTMPAAET